MKRAFLLLGSIRLGTLLGARILRTGEASAWRKSCAAWRLGADSARNQAMFPYTAGLIAGIDGRHVLAAFTHNNRSRYSRPTTLVTASDDGGLTWTTRSDGQLIFGPRGRASESATPR